MKVRHRRPHAQQIQQLGKLVEQLQARASHAEMETNKWKLRFQCSDAELKTLRETVQRIGRIAAMAGQT